jgi:hypothetical protein
MLWFTTENLCSCRILKSITTCKRTLSRIDLLKRSLSTFLRYLTILTCIVCVNTIPLRMVAFSGALRPVVMEYVSPKRRNIHWTFARWQSSKHICDLYVWCSIRFQPCNAYREVSGGVKVTHIATDGQIVSQSILLSQKGTYSPFAETRKSS